MTDVRLCRRKSDLSPEHSDELEGIDAEGTSFLWRKEAPRIKELLATDRPKAKPG